MHGPGPARKLGLVGTLSLLAVYLVALTGTARGNGAPVQHPPVAGAPVTDVMPFPGTPDASPQTQIVLAAVAPLQVQALSVRGSTSGTHAGRLDTMRGGTGSAFVVRRPFAAGEHVSVLAKIRVPSGHSAISRRISFGFVIAAPVAASRSRAAKAAERLAPLTHAAPSPVGKTQSFYSEPWLHPPILLQSGKLPDPGQGDFLADAENSIQAGPLIFDSSGRLVWFQPLQHAAAFNVEVQQYLGQSVLTYWQGYVVPPGYGIGADQVLNHSYQTIATVQAADGYQADLHEFQITSQGNALITSFAPVRANLSSVGGSRNGTLLDSIVQEINIATGQLLWEWHAYGHVHISESYEGKPGSTPYDFFHVNSIQQLADGNFLVSARSTSAVYEIDRATGRIMWILGGKHSSFKMGSGTKFWWQHDARLHAGNIVTVFDDGAGSGVTSQKQSRGLRIRVNTRTHRATLVRAYTSSPSVLATSQGNVQVMPDGNTLVGWGSAQYLSEFDRSGHQRFSAHFYAPIGSYRDYRAQWYGQPSGTPYAAAAATSSGTTLYASWDGATDVAAWQVLAGPSPTSLTPVARAGFEGFETAVPTSSTQPYFAVQALGSSGQVLGTSAPVGR